MSQTNHGSIEFLKFPDPQHPGDNTHLIKKWLRDSWARRKIAELQSQTATQSQITALQNQISTLQSNYTALKARVSALEGNNQGGT